MPACPVCGKDVQPDASFCPSCGSNLQTNAAQMHQPVTQQTNFVPMQQSISGEQQLRSMVKRLERVSYITAGAAGILLVIIVLLLI